MTNKRALATLLVMAALGGLGYLQFRTWRDFQWDLFVRETARANWLMILAAVAIIYFDYYLRALRWKIFLRPVKRVSAARLTAPMFIGFTALALLGRPGELLRPYLIAKKEELPVESQMAVWAVERLFDMGAFAVLLSVNMMVARSLEGLPHIAQFRRAGFLLGAFIVVMGALAYAVRRNAKGVSDWVERRLSRISRRFAARVAERVLAFGKGLNTIHDARSFFQIAGISLLLWFSIGVAYVLVTRAYGQPALNALSFPAALLLMGSSMVGSMLQLPAVGGGSQLATISVMENVFRIPKELALSCGIMLWLVTFVAVVPAGLALARREQLTLRRLREEGVQHAGRRAR